MRRGGGKNVSDCEREEGEEGSEPVERRSDEGAEEGAEPVDPASEKERGRAG